MTTVGPTRAGKSEEQDREGAARTVPGASSRWPGIRELLTGTVPVTLFVAAVLHVVWRFVFANSGGDLAAQDAWAEFALQHPASAYNLAWYGGMHPVSYSAISPYLMAQLGVRPTMMIAGTVSAGLIALLVVRSRAVRRPLWPSLYGAFAMACNAISGRVTFALGVMFGLAAIAMVFAWPARWRAERRYRWLRGGLAALAAALATASSPVAGLYVGIVAAALWLGKRRPAAYALGLTPVAVVGLSAWLFPFSGQQPMTFPSTILPLVIGFSGLAFTPKEWRIVRIASGLYVVGVLLVWLIPSQIGTNISRLGMVFGGVVLLAALQRLETPPRAEWLRTGRKWTAAVLAVATVTIWQGANSGADIVNTTPAASWARELAPLVDRLQKLDAGRGRVEVVPARSHREASAVAPYVNLARGWNRQADMKRNPLFYKEDLLTAGSYRQWLDRWAVHYVVLPTDEPDHAAVKEAELVAKGQPYLEQIWSDANWRLYAVKNPTPLAAPPAEVLRADADELTISVKSAGPVLIRIPYTPWLGLVDEAGKPVEPPKAGPNGEPPVNERGCLTKRVDLASGDERPEDDWTVLHAPHAGTYRIGAPYKLPRGTGCPDDLAR